MPATAAMYGLTPAERFDPAKAIDAQAHLMHDLLRQFGAVPLALAAYNAGPGECARAAACRPSLRPGLRASDPCAARRRGAWRSRRPRAAPRRMSWRRPHRSPPGGHAYPGRRAAAAQPVTGDSGGTRGAVARRAAALARCARRLPLPRPARKGDLRRQSQIAQEAVASHFVNPVRPRRQDAPRRDRPDRHDHGQQ